MKEYQVRATYDEYEGKRRYYVSHPSRKGSVLVAAPDPNSAIVAAAPLFKMKWTSYAYYSECVVQEA